VECATSWFEELSIPSFPPNVRFINIPPPFSSPAYTERLEALAIQSHDEAIGYCSNESDWDSDAGRYEDRPSRNDRDGWIWRDLSRDMELFQQRISSHVLRRFLIDQNNILIPNLSISLHSDHLETFVRRLCRGRSLPDLDARRGFLPFYPSNDISSFGPSSRPITRVYPPFSLLTPLQSQRPDADVCSMTDWVVNTDLFWEEFFTNVHLVRYPVGHFVRLALQSRLEVERNGHVHGQRVTLSGWRWLEEDGSLTPVIEENAE
jgi:hypothetical protein